MKRFLFIRHGSTAGNLEKRYIGSSDEALCPLGEEQIRQLKGQQLQADFLFVSPMLRTRQSAAILFPQLPVNLVENFRETDFGLFEGKTAVELSASAHAAAYQDWLDSQCLSPIPLGESVSDFKERCCSAFLQVAAAVPDNSCTALVVHGGVIMAICERFAVPKQSFYDYHIKNGQVLFGNWSGEQLQLVHSQS